MNDAKRRILDLAARYVCPGRVRTFEVMGIDLVIGRREGYRIWDVEGRELLDLNYVEDKDAEVDFNIVMTGQGQFVEVQGSGEEATFTHAQLQSLITLAQSGLKELASLQTAFMTKHLLKL